MQAVHRGACALRIGFCQAPLVSTYSMRYAQWQRPQPQLGAVPSGGSHLVGIRNLLDVRKPLARAASPLPARQRCRNWSDAGALAALAAAVGDSSGDPPAVHEGADKLLRDGGFQEIVLLRGPCTSTPTSLTLQSPASQ